MRSVGSAGPVCAAYNQLAEGVLTCVLVYDGFTVCRRRSVEVPAASTVRRQQLAANLPILGRGEQPSLEFTDEIVEFTDCLKAAVRKQLSTRFGVRCLPGHAQCTTRCAGALIQ